MFNGFGESTSGQPLSPSFSNSNSNSNSNDAGNFECNICFDLAQDPIVTLCGHLFCWSCLYKWLHIHSHSHECPVCKALVEEQKLVPLYGRGKTSTDPRAKLIPGINIPNRPAGQRPETAPPPERTHFPPHEFGSVGGGLTFSAAFGVLVPPLLNLHLHGFPDPAMYVPAANFSYEFPNFSGQGVPNRYHNHTQQGRHDFFLKRLLFIIGFCALLAFIWQ